MQKKHIAKSAEETQKMGTKLAKDILGEGFKKTAVVLALRGDLGAGKTTFLQGFAKGLGIKEKITSPTFVIQKRFELKNKKFKNFYHIDCYRIKNGKDILAIGLKDIILNPENIVAIEWPERVNKILPKSSIKIGFKCIDKDNREIVYNK